MPLRLTESFPSFYRGQGRLHTDADGYSASSAAGTRHDAISPAKGLLVDDTRHRFSGTYLIRATSLLKRPLETPACRRCRAPPSPSGAPLAESRIRAPEDTLFNWAECPLDVTTAYLASPNNTKLIRLSSANGRHLMVNGILLVFFSETIAIDTPVCYTSRTSYPEPAGSP